MAFKHPGSQPPDSESSRWDQLERKEGQLWRYALWLGLLLAVAWAASEWEHLKSLPLNLMGIPTGVVVLMGLFAVYAYQKRLEILELRSFVRGIRERNEAPPTAQQLERLFDFVEKSQRGYRELIDSFDDVVFAFSLDGKLQTANRSLEVLMGEPIDTLVGRDLGELLSEPTREMAQKDLARFLDRRYWNGTVKVRVRATGGVRYYDTILQAIVSDGQVTGVSALARDVTKAREAEARFTELFETLQEGIYVRTADGEMLNANPALAKMLGYESADELLNVPWKQLCEASVHSGNPGRPGDGSMKGEIRLRRKDGGSLLCEATTTPLYDAAGNVARYQGTLVDITQKKEMEENLHREQEFARRLVASFPDMITALDREGRYTFITPNYTELTGYSFEEMIGRPFGVTITPEDFARVRDAFHELTSGRQSQVALEYRVSHRDGRPRTVATIACPLTDSSGQITGVVASTRDLTERRRLEQQIMQTEKLAAMGRMIAGVAHELNNPLTVILGASDTTGAPAIDAASNRRFEMIQQQARRTADIVQNLLSFSRPPSPERKSVDLSELLSRTLQLCDYSLRVNCITVDMSSTEGLPSVVGDAAQLVQVFVNLIINAEQAIREVRDRGTIRIRSGQSGDKVWVSFQDDGPGISEQILPNIFDPFFTTKRPGRGTGLGLSICLSILREHGGEIEAQPATTSAIGLAEGSVFTVTLPIAKAAAIRSDTPPAPLPFPELRERTILVVDDEPGILELIRMTLRNRGMAVECSRSADEGLQMMVSHKFDFVLCDMKMPKGSGKDLYDRAVEQIAVMPPFILMAGDPTDPVTVEFAQSANVTLMPKPFTIADLLRVLGASPDRRLHERAS
jgi:two-component system NtrC family sensor kinase